MSKRLNQVQKELDKRRQRINKSVKRSEKIGPMMMNRYEDEREEDFHMNYSDRKQDLPEIKNYFVLRSLIAVCLFLCVAIVFKSSVPQLEKVKQVVQQSFEQEFQFALIADWYEGQFGRPLALVPIQQNVAQGDPIEQVEMIYALPANGVIHEDFEQNGQGILIETGTSTEVEAVRGGYVIAVGEGLEVNIGKTVIVQHYDGAESYYGMLDVIGVNMYDHIQAGDKIGTVSTSTDEQGGKGIFYFALKQNNQYIDPGEVLNFD